ncbi:MAG: thiamine-phosphate kinase [Myxococcota bacterium]
MASEEERIAALRSLFSTSADVRVGIGDDAAVLAPDLVLSVDAAIEGTHFRRTFGSCTALARRAAMAALSDLAAMGASPQALLSSLILPPGFSDFDLEALHHGLREAADEVGASVVGGNLAKGSALSLTTTVVGRASEPLRRSGAAPGDGIYVSGPPGDAALGLCALLAGRASAFANVWLRPRAHIEEGLRLRGAASACVDISDGLLQDLGHLCAESGVGARIDAKAIPRGDGFADEAQALSARPDEVLLAGGEAYVLLFTARNAPPLGTRIGEVTASPGIEVDGALAPETRGFDHFS